MKIFDLKKGRFFGVNAIDLIVLLVVLFLAVSILSSTFLSDKLSFDGNEMYKAIQTHQNLDSKGFLVEGEIIGNWIADEAEYHGRGLIIGSRGGEFELKTLDGDVIRVGGSMGYVEDIAASKIIFHPVDNYVAMTYMEPVSYSNYDDFLDHLEKISSESRADHLYVTTRLALDTPLSETDLQNIINALEGMYLIRDYEIEQAGEEGIIIDLDRVEVSEIAKLKIPVKNVVTGRMKVDAGYEHKPEKEGVLSDWHIASLEELL